MYEKGYVSKAQKVSEELNLQKAKFTYEQATERCKSQGGTELSPCFGCDC